MLAALLLPMHVPSECIEFNDQPTNSLSYLAYLTLVPQVLQGALELTADSGHDEARLQLEALQEQRRAASRLRSSHQQTRQPELQRWKHGRGRPD